MHWFDYLWFICFFFRLCNQDLILKNAFFRLLRGSSVALLLKREGLSVTGISRIREEKKNDKATRYAPRTERYCSRSPEITAPVMPPGFAPDR